MPHSTFCVVRLFVCCDALIVVVFRVGLFSVLCGFLFLVLGLYLALYGLFSFLFALIGLLLLGLIRLGFDSSSSCFNDSLFYFALLIRLNSLV